MTDKNVLVIIKSRPFKTLNYYEALRTAAGLWDHKVNVLWFNEGVYSAINSIDKTLSGKFLVDLPDLDIGLYVDGESLKKTGFKDEDLVEKAKIADEDKIIELLDAAEITLVF